jgi:carbon-monoxide dehydrogenase large subunit
MAHGLRRFLAEQLFGMPQCHVRMVSGGVGQSFGMRHGVYPELGLVLWGAKRLGRPVKWTAGGARASSPTSTGGTMCRRVQLAGEADAIAVNL